MEKKLSGKGKGKQTFDHICEIIVSGCYEFYKSYTDAEFLNIPLLLL